MKLLIALLIGGALFFSPPVAFAAVNPEVSQFTNNSFAVLITLASLASVVFLIRGGFLYITSTGKPDELDQAKKTIRNALIGLAFVIGSGVFSSVLHTAFTTPSEKGTTESVVLKPIEPVEPASGLTQVLIDAVVGFIQAIVQSATQPIIDGVIGFLTTTPALVTNSVVFNFWLSMVGIVDSLFVIIIALLGFHVMSASTFGFDEIEFKHLLPRIGLAFLGANTSLFLIDWIITLCNALVQSVLNATGGLSNAYVLDAVNPATLIIGQGGVNLVTLIFMLLFLILAIVLLLFYIARLITIAVGAVLSPFVFLLWLLPGFTDFATVAVRSYVIMIFTVFVHVVIIQLASSFLTIPGQVGTNAPISILVGIGTMFSLLKSPGVMLQFAFYSAANGALRKLGGQIIHVVSSIKSTQSGSNATASGGDTTPRPRKTVAL